ncbi:hypothetical protein [Candidatus Symbiopectobacterium sp. PLON1]|uniref:hypothetical protein n=1 Tax=Candidatus Symbiopectobacterium sp. PLON1 TaxID=2794575 RepID=UPI0025BA1273|nr:hypothetical protein [Candidatus Symbiopectobacterium sp. PLON1]
MATSDFYFISAILHIIRALLVGKSFPLCNVLCRLSASRPCDAFYSHNEDEMEEVCSGNP